MFTRTAIEEQLSVKVVMVYFIVILISIVIHVISGKKTVNEEKTTGKPARV
jgi:succinate dehydrogenase hydrophobic anchor subunit